MWCVEAKAGEGPATEERPMSRARLLRFEARRRDVEGMRLALLVAADFELPLEELFEPARCRAEVALARQAGMYLMHVALGRLYADVGRFFGRDRTTVSHACALIEEMRETALFDERLGRIEQQLAAPEPQETSHAAA